MHEARTKSILGFDKAYKMLEVLVQADFGETARRAMMVAFGASPEFNLIKVLSVATQPLRLSEISARSGATRRAMSPDGSLRLLLERMQRAGILVNEGSTHRPLYSMNLLNDESKVLIFLFEDNSPLINLPVSRRGK